MNPVATVRSPYTREGPRIPRREIVADIVVRDDLADALTGIEDWSHLIVLFWMPQPRQWPGPLLTHPRHRIDLPQVGVFAGRGRERPNPIGLAVVELLQRRQNVLTVRALDAFDGSEVLDIKPYDAYDVVEQPRAPQWWLQLAPPRRG
jgi:tRNA-Thr(GGU) m(6)t(6)A37 methyltransferase TsaA